MRSNNNLSPLDSGGSTAESFTSESTSSSTLSETDPDDRDHRSNGMKSPGSVSSDHEETVYKNNGEYGQYNCIHLELFLPLHPLGPWDIVIISICPSTVSANAISHQSMEGE